MARSGAAGRRRRGRGVAGRLVGWVGPLRVRLSRLRDGESRGTRITISGPGLPAGVTVRPEGFGGSIRGRGVREIEVGHEGFDAAAWVEGPRPPGAGRCSTPTPAGRSARSAGGPAGAAGSLALLGDRAPGRRSAARRRARRVPAPAAAWLFDGAGARPRNPERPRTSAGLAHLPEVLQRSIALARRLARRRTSRRRLADEPEGPSRWPRVRLQNLVTLAREFPSHPATREALLAAREDPDAEVRAAGRRSPSGPRAATCCSPSRAGRARRTRRPSGRSSRWARTSPPRRPRASSGARYARAARPPRGRAWAPSASAAGPRSWPRWRRCWPSRSRSWPSPRPTPSVRQATRRRRRRSSPRSAARTRRCGRPRRGRSAG